MAAPVDPGLGFPLRLWKPEELAALPVFTPWTINPQADRPLALTDDERAKDLQFRGLLTDLLVDRALWLLPILGAAGAVPIAWAGRLYVAIPAHGYAMVEIPGLDQYLQLLPWPEQGQTVN